jgi:hypothetical protein
LYHICLEGAAHGNRICGLFDLSPSWLEGLTEAFGDPDVALVGGPSLPEFQDKPPEWLDNLWDEDKGRRMLVALSLIDSGPAALYLWAQLFDHEGSV